MLGMNRQQGHVVILVAEINRYSLLDQRKNVYAVRSEKYSDGGGTLADWILVVSALERWCDL